MPTPLTNRRVLHHHSDLFFLHIAEGEEAVLPLRCGQVAVTHHDATLFDRGARRDAHQRLALVVICERCCYSAAGQDDQTGAGAAVAEHLVETAFLVGADVR